jgi:NAD(P)-dependent dehydrogenase (short-subunit alcohol dehydrogenase family)
VFVPSDLAGPPSDIRAFAAAALNALDGRIDVLVNNAAACPATTMLELTEPRQFRAVHRGAAGIPRPGHDCAGGGPVNADRGLTVRPNRA